MLSENETGLSRHEQNKCVEDLKQKNVLETRYERLDHRLYYRINRDALDEIMEADLPSEIRKTDFGKSENRRSPNQESGPREIGKTDFGIKKQENTTENTHKRNDDDDQSKLLAQLQSAAAKAIGIRRQALNLWLKGTQGPSGEQALALLDFLVEQRTKKR